MADRKIITVVLAAVLLSLSVIPRPVTAAGQTSPVSNPDFENTGSSAWFKTATYGNGTVTVYDTTYSHSPTHAAMLNASKTALRCSAVECRDSVRATVEQYLPLNAPTLNSLANVPDSFSAWWYVADPATTGMPTYSIHIGIGFTDGNSIEYWYGTSDLSIQRYNLGPIPVTGQWFQMGRNLATDIQPLNIANPSGTRVSYIWFAAFGNITRGEIAWVDDVAILFTTPLPPPPVAVFSASTVQGPAPLTVSFDASQSYASTGYSITSYSWSFGDGSPTGSDRRVSHTYTQPGSFQVVLTVQDSSGQTSRSSPLTITAGGGDPTGPLLFGVGGGVLLLSSVIILARRRRHSLGRKRKRRF